MSTVAIVESLWKYGKYKGERMPYSASNGVVQIVQWYVVLFQNLANDRREYQLFGKSLFIHRR